MASTLISKNVTIDGRRTSLRMEVEIWEALDDICHRESLSVHEVCSLIDQRRHGSSRTSAVRAFIVTYFRTVALNAGTLDQDRKTLGRIAELLSPQVKEAPPPLDLKAFSAVESALTGTGTGKRIPKRQAG